MTSDNWKTVSLGSIAEFRNGINYDKSNLGTGIKVIGVANFQDYTSISLENLAEINPDGVVSKEDLLKDGDILFVRSNGNKALIGRSLYIDKLQEQVTFSGFTIRLRFTSEQIYPLFFAYFFKSHLIRRVFLELGGGTNISNLSQQLLRNLVVQLPPHPEQHKIANILSTWDHAIDLTTQLIEAKQQHKRGLMQQLLTGKKRFAQFNEPWKMVRIGDLLSESRIEGSNGRTAHKITVRLYGKGVQPKEEKSLGSEATKYYRRYAGQFIYSKLDFLNGAFGIIPTEMDGYESTLDLPCFDFQGSVLPKFFLYFVSREHFYSKFASAAIGGRKARRIQIEEFLSTEIELPNLDEQKCIAQVLDAGDQELALLNRKLALLKKQKQGLMQQLLTGKVRVKL